MIRIFKAAHGGILPILMASALALAGLSGAAAGNAYAASDSVEGVWSFNGGQIAVQRQANGTYAGTVVAETKFAECVHPVGQEIWTEMTEQADGSFWGLHHWYLSNCEENQELGPTAWRVLETAGKSRYMRVCFSHPGTTQPMIASGGAPLEASEYPAYHVTYGCYDSALVASLPGSSGGSAGGNDGGGSTESLALPRAKQCLAGKRFKIRLRNPQHDPFKTVVVKVNGHKVATKAKNDYVIATVNLARLAKPTFTVTVHATTVLGNRLSAKRTYHACGKARAKPRLKKR